MSLKTKATAAITALALALGSVAISATPAAALGKKDRQALSILLGVGAAALLLDGMNKKDHKAKKAQPRYESWQDRQRRLARERRERERREAEARRQRAQERYDRDHRRYSHDRDRIRLPAQCVQRVKTGRGWGEVVSASCLDRRTERRLPANCAFTMKTGRHGVEKVYGSNCLEDRGIRLSRR
ncbi:MULTISPECIES: hypothetical protein [Thioclava]|uniref:hypothetical protein n=1 Tax=Thioclava TaxID=285107 RepID=UPI000C679D1B|nr:MULTISPECIES: hypothetical protein [Thioclava]MAQ36368.1 hypothetical protein [Thioclava sp.]